MVCPVADHSKIRSYLHEIGPSSNGSACQHDSIGGAIILNHLDCANEQRPKCVVMKESTILAPPKWNLRKAWGSDRYSS